jgi:hypothetical protein
MYVHGMVLGDGEGQPEKSRLRQPACQVRLNTRMQVHWKLCGKKHLAKSAAHSMRNLRVLQGIVADSLDRTFPIAP